LHQAVHHFHHVQARAQRAVDGTHPPQGDEERLSAGRQLSVSLQSAIQNGSRSPRGSIQGLDCTKQSVLPYDDVQ
jgi:hypothetical protein